MANGQWPMASQYKGSRKKEITKVTYILHLPQRQKKSSYLLHFIFIFIFMFLSIFFGGVFGAFRNKGNSKTQKKKSEKIHLGSSQKMRFFFPPFFSPPPRLFCSIFFLIVFLGVS
jgi:hypothetical protein